MIAGTVLLLAEPSDDTLHSKDTGGFATIDVRETQEYLDGAAVQQGRACDIVETHTEEIHVDGGTIATESVLSIGRFFTEWVADVVDAGFIATERTEGEEFPMGLFEAALGTDIARAQIDPGAFIAAQLRADKNPDTWFTGQKVEYPEGHPNDVQMGYGDDSTTAQQATEANIGIGFETSWQGKRLKGIVYSGGYLAVHNDSVGPVQFARFVREEIMPHAEAVEEDEAANEQAGVDEFADSVDDERGGES